MKKINFIFSICALLILYPIQFKASNSYNADFDSLKLIVKNYLLNGEPKSELIRQVEGYKIINDGYKDFVTTLNDSTHSQFYRILATLNNENNKWFEEQSLDFLRMGLRTAKTENDSVRCYHAIVISYFKKIVVELDSEERNEIKKQLDTVINEINTLSPNTENIFYLKQASKHNLSIIERLIGNFQEAKNLLTPIINLNYFTFGEPNRKIEAISNGINELGRTYLSEGILKNDDDLIRQSIDKFNEGIALLEKENCSPYHLEELYQRKQKGLFYLGRENEAIAVADKLNTFSRASCWQSNQKDSWLFYQSIVNDFPNIEIIEDNALSIMQKEILKENDKIKTYLLFAILAVAALLAFAALSWWNKKNELSKKNTELERTIAKLKILQFNASAVLETIKNFDAKQGKLDFLNKYLIDIFNQFKDQMKEDCGFTAVLFNRKKYEIASKIIAIGEKGNISNEDAKNHRVNTNSIYYPFYKGQKKLYTEQNFQHDFQNHNSSVTKQYLTKNEITTESIICVPLVFNQNEKPLGIITLQNDSKAFFNKDHIDLMKAIANMLTPVVAYFEINEERNEIRQQKNHIIKLLNHRFRNYIDINNTALQNIKHNLPKWNEEKLREKLISFGGDFQIYINTFKSFMRWLGLLGFEKNNFESAYQVEDFNLKTALENEFEQLYFPLREHNIAYKILSDENITISNIPKIYISEIVANLLINCIQHFMEIEQKALQPKITIETKFREEYLVLSINDNGEGIPESIKDNIFKSALNGNYDKSEGRGLGNMAVKYLTNKIDGNIKVAYSSKSKGTKIEILIPQSNIKVAKHEK